MLNSVSQEIQIQEWLSNNFLSYVFLDSLYRFYHPLKSRVLIEFID